MPRFIRLPRRLNSAARRNVSAGLVFGGALAAFYLDYEPATSQAPSVSVDLSRFTAAAAVSDGSASGSAASGAESLTGTPALRRSLELLEAGAARLGAVRDYTALLLKQERIGGVLGEQQLMQLKLRHEPFSVYVKSIAGEDLGREVLYVAGENDGEMLVKLGGLQGRLLPAVNVDPAGSLALAQARHPITNVGLLNLTNKVIEHTRHDIETGGAVRCTMIDGRQFGGRDCYCFVREFADPAYYPPYRKSVQYVDKELCVPISIQNYGWPEDGEIPPERLDDATLLEHYAYSEIRFEQRLADRDFDRDNAKYSFRR